MELWKENTGLGITDTFINGFIIIYVNNLKNLN